MKKLRIVNEVRINGKWIREEDMDPEEFHRLMIAKSDYAMGNQGFVRKDKTA